MSTNCKRQKLDEPSAAPFFPVLSTEYTEDTPLTDVYSATIADRKNISKIIVQLNAALPLPSLTHLKRIKGNEVILYEATDEHNTEQVFAILETKKISRAYFRPAAVRKTSVAKIPPKTRRHYEAVHQLWPCNFHSNAYVEKLCANVLFSQNEIDRHVSFMRIAIDVAKSSKSDCKIGVVVVDEEINSVVAVGVDERHSHPCKHAVMIVIDQVALTQNGGAWKNVTTPTNEGVFDLRGIPSEILSVLSEKHSHIQLGARRFKNKNEIESPTDGPYLCTGYTAYVTREPCVMCAMAFVHSRIKRVFYGSKYNSGALGSLCKIHTVKDLNHHFEVFGGLLQDECSMLH